MWSLSVCARAPGLIPPLGRLPLLLDLDSGLAVRAFIGLVLGGGGLVEGADREGAWPAVDPLGSTSMVRGPPPGGCVVAEGAAPCECS